MALIHILDAQTDQILDDIPHKYVPFNVHRQSLKDYQETFEFEALAGKSFSQMLAKRNRIIIPGEFGELREFIIYEAIENRVTRNIEVYSWASYHEDLKKAKVIKAHKTNPETALQHVNIALAGTGWTPGNITYAGIRTITFENNTNPFGYLKRVAREFELELDFRVEIENGKITRYVDLVERLGEYRGREVVLGKDLLSLTRKENTADIVTALWVYGPEREDGTRLEVFVEDEEALQRWGRNGQHLVGEYEPQSTDVNMTIERLTQLGRAELDKRINAIVEYEGGIADLENVPGMEHEQIRFADTIRIKDESYSPALYLEARIHSQERDIFVKSNKKVELGDYVEFTEEEVTAIWKQLQKEIRKKISLAQMLEYAEPKKIMSDTPPTEQTENVTWIDTSQIPYVPKVYNFGEWQKLSPTTAGEVDAYTKLETDSITKDASRLETGIIDVGAVPLRTSVTGARIEWDGINGLVQYDMDGNPVSWLDLEGNAHFENGYFSGEIHAESGTFSGTVEGAEIKTSRFEYEDAFAKLVIGDGPWLDIISKLDGFNTKIMDAYVALATGPYEDDELLSLAPSNIVNHNKHLTIMAENAHDGSLLPVHIRHADIEAIGNKAIRIHGGDSDHTYIEFYRSWTEAGRSAYMGYGSAGTSIFTFRNDLGDFDFQSFVRVNRLLNRNYNNVNLVRTYASGVVDVNAGNGPLRLGYEGTTYVQIHASQLRHEYAGDFYIRPFPGYDIRVADKDGTWRYVRAAGLIESSSRKFKKNIRNYEENALEKIITTPIRWFHFKEELDEEFPHVGVIMEESPAEIVDIKGEGVSSYAMVALSWKAIQQLNQEIENIKEQLGGIA